MVNSFLSFLIFEKYKFALIFEESSNCIKLFDISFVFKLSFKLLKSIASVTVPSKYVLD